AKLPSMLHKEVFIKSKALRRTIRRFNFASKATSDAIWEWDFSRNRIYRSKNFGDLFGYSPSKYKMDQKIFEGLIHPDDLDRAKKNFEAFIEGKEKLWKQEFRFLKENGEYAHVLDKGFLIRKKDGSPGKFFGAIQDITLLKQREIELLRLTQKLDQRAKELQRAFHQLEDSEKRYRELFELSPLPMWVYDLETLEFVDVNNAAIDSYGFSRNEFLSKTIKELRPSEEIPYLEAELDKRKNNDGFIFSGIFQHKKKSGELVDVEISTNKIRYKNLPAVLVLAVDVTLRNKYIAAIEVQNTKLKEIAWIQSHIVRAPLARLVGLVDLLEMEKRDDPDRSVATFDELFGYIRSSANELDDVIKEIIEKTERIEMD
ncbi:MAG: PAS domain S-box protein, partial [Cyclobacteriaceae bacterium]|nr:PAS domain S-box protein [Cyclobacteriaceae bacterium]